MRIGLRDSRVGRLPDGPLYASKQSLTVLKLRSTLAWMPGVIYACMRAVMCSTWWWSSLLRSV